MRALARFFPRLFCAQILIAALAVSGAGLVAAQETQPLSIIRVTPSGEDVPDARQVVIEFNRPVVPVGKMDRTAEELGIKIEPALACQWRWLNTTSLSCNLDEKSKMAMATKYSLTIEPKIAAEDGAKIAASETHEFTTLRPSVERATFKTWRGPGSPVIRIISAQPLTKTSVAAHLYIQQDDGPATRYKLAVRPDPDSRELPVMLKVPGEKLIAITGGGKQKPDDRLVKNHNGESRRVWLVEPVKELPANASFALYSEAGLVSAAGPEEGTQATDIVHFITYPEKFIFAGVKCTNNKNEDILIAPGKPQGPDQRCNPLSQVSLAFNSPVLRSEVAGSAKFSPPLAADPKFDAWNAKDNDYSRLGSPRENKEQLYTINPAVFLKAAQEYKVSFKTAKVHWWQKIIRKFRHQPPLPGNISDEFGRPLEPLAGEFSFSTDHRRPNYELDKHDVVLEKAVDSELPFYVNNLDSYDFTYGMLTAEGGQKDQKKNFPVAKPLDIQYAVPFGIREALGGKSGAIYGFVSANPAVEKYPNEPRLFAQVTPWEVHFKLGHESGLAWVTDLATGKPVEGVKITVYSSSFSDFMNITPSAEATTGEGGIALLPGTVTLDPDIQRVYSWEDSAPHLFLRAQKGDDVAVLPLTNDFEIETWRVAENLGSYSHGKYELMRAWGMTAQGVYRAGDTMQYKIFVRGQGNEALVPPPKGDYTLEIRDALGNVVDTVKELKLSEFGTYAGEYKIPGNASVGWYSFQLTGTFEMKEDGSEKRTVSLSPMRVLVSDFTPASFHVENELNGDLFKAGDRMEISAGAKLHSGGAYTQASVRTTVTLFADTFTSKDPLAQGFNFSGLDTYQPSMELYQKSAPLDDKGEWKDTFEVPANAIPYGHLEVESAVQDDRGKAIAASSRASYFSVDRLVGLKQLEWVYPDKKPATVKMIVVDTLGKPAPGVAIKGVIEREEITTSRVKGAGNAYLSDITREWKQKATCEATSANDAVDCTFTPDSAGSYRLTASIVDSKGVTHSSREYLWVSGSDYVQWNDQSDLALQILPEKEGYKVGDTARFLVKNPYPGASALVTVERYGVIDSFTKTLEGSTPVIEVPIKPDYVPGFYLSIVVTSPRVDAPPPEIGQIDMGKPAFRMGYVTVPVADPYKQMTVTAKADQEVYRPRDKVKVTLNAVPLNAPDKPQPAELAVAVLDDAVFDLVQGGRKAFDPYDGFYSLDMLDMRNYSLLLRLVGRQKFEKKGANPGGDGGNDVNMRNLFKFVSYWNPSVPVDENGNAEIEFEAPDNLTGWHILALAVTPGDRMGLGEAGFKVNRPTEIRPVMPNQVREEDKFSAGFSVTNRTDHERTLKMSIAASGDVKAEGSLTKEEEVKLAPYERKTIFFPLQAMALPMKRETQTGSIAFDVVAGDAEDTDGVHQDLPVLKARVLQVGADYGTTTEESVTSSVAVPKDIYPDTGSVDVVLAPSVLGNIEGAFKYMRDYLYDCWEQVLTRGVMAAHYGQLKAYMPDEFVWKDSEKLPQEALDHAAEYQAPNGGMAYFVATDDRVDPYLSAYTALAFGWLKKDGYKVPEAVSTKLNSYLQTFLAENAAPDFYQEGMKSTVRAVALAALAQEGKATSADIDRYRPHVKEMSLFGKAEYLMAALSVKDADPAIAKEVADMIFATGSESGGKFSFNETYDDGYARILATPLRDNCAILSAFSMYAGIEEGRKLIGDKPFKLVRMITQTRGNRDHWENTQENMFCMNALADYARAYEKESPDMTVTANIGETKIGEASFDDVRDPAITLSHPIAETDIGNNEKLVLTRDGKGRLYFANRLSFALKSVADQPVNAGIDIRREYSVKRDGKWKLLENPAAIHRGELVRVDLFVSLPTARNFVVVNDPLPGGLETVNTDLATASNVDDRQAEYDEAGGSFWFHYGDWNEYNFSLWSFYHRELRADSVRFYSDWLPAGNYHLSYAAQAIAEGSFSALPVRAEEMYDPDIYGLGTQARLDVGAAP